MISIAIPVYETRGKGKEYLKFQFEKFLEQTYQDFEVVISDHSVDDEIKKVCEEYNNRLDIRYLRNEEGRGLSSVNINNAIKNCTGKIIKIIFQDDFLWDKNSLFYTVESFDSDTNWLVSACQHTRDDGETFYRAFYPRYNDKIYLGNNTISSPSVLSIRNTQDKIYFDDRLIWLMDVDYYKMLYDKYGSPKILNKITIVNRDHPHQLSHAMGAQVKEREYHMMLKKHLYNKKEIKK